MATTHKARNVTPSRTELRLSSRIRIGAVLAVSRICSLRSGDHSVGTITFAMRKDSVADRYALIKGTLVDCFDRVIELAGELGIKRLERGDRRTGNNVL